MGDFGQPGLVASERANLSSYSGSKHPNPGQGYADCVKEGGNPSNNSYCEYDEALRVQL